MPKADVAKHNNSGCYNLAPFTVHPTLYTIYIYQHYLEYIRDTWFYQQLHYLACAIIPVSSSDTLPYPETQDPDKYPLFDKVHGLHLAWYNATNWAPKCLPDTILVTYSKLEQEALYRLSSHIIHIGALRGNKLKRYLDDYDLKALDIRLQTAIDTILQHVDTQCREGVFIKLSNFSPKKTTTPYPITTTEQVWNYLLSSARCQSGLTCGAILVKPWEPAAAASYSNEFRAFIQDHQLVGISQQSIYEHYPVMKTTYANIAAELASKIQNLWTTTIQPHTDYRDGTLDVYYDPQTNKVRLIEINPYGAWSGAGAAWYNWINDSPAKGMELQLRITEG